MKYIVVSYNYLTLSKSIIYAKHVWGEENTQIIFLPTVSDIKDSEILKKFNILRVELRYPKVFLKSFKEICECMVQAKTVLSQINDIAQKYDSKDLTFVVFKDQQIRECAIINTLKSKYKKAKIILMEEGLALYANITKSSFSIKRMIYSAVKILFGVPKYFLENHPMGLNPAVDKIICSNPEALMHRGFSKNAELEAEYNVFDEDQCDYLLKNLFKADLGGKKIDFAFLTQPIYPRSKFDDEKYEKFLSELVFTLKKRGSVLIKKHPRDKWNYDSFKDQNVQICDDKVNHIPFECVWGAYGKPQMITLFSSAVCISSSKKRSIFLYNLLPESIGNGRLDEKIVNNPKYVICNNFAELNDVLES